MSFNFVNLDAETRKFMLKELEKDRSEANLYISPRLTSEGQSRYPELLKQAIESHDEDWLAKQLRMQGKMKTEEQRKKPSGGFTTAKVPVTAPDTLAEGEFNRFYCRALCARALQNGIEYLVIYRAKQVQASRPESVDKENTHILAKQLLHDLRTHQGVEPALGLPPGPNSGLSVKLP
jgi:hypothetical protein